VVKVTNFRIFAYFLFDMLDLGHEGSPEASVLDSLNFDYIRLRKSLLEIRFNSLKVGGGSIEFDHDEELLGVP
jgi:hypothetical protein